MRVLLTGAPTAGKSTLAQQMAQELGLEWLCTDPSSLGGHGHCPVDDWSSASAYIAEHWIGQPNTLIEGVAVPRALRKWRAAHPGEPFPADLMIVLMEPRQPLKPGQAQMAAGLHHVIDELRADGWIPPELIEFR